MRLARGLLFAVGGMLLVSLTACGPVAGTSAGGTTVAVTKVGTVPWLAAQDGSGAWQALSSTTFTVSDTVGRYGVAWVCTLPSGQPLVQVTQESMSEGTVVTADCRNVPDARYNISGTVSGIPGSGSAFISAGSAVTTATDAGAGLGQYTLSGAYVGSQTLLAYGLSSSGAFSTMVRTILDVTGNRKENIDLSTGTTITGSDSLGFSSIPSGSAGSPYLGAYLVPTGTPAVVLAGIYGKMSLTYPLVPGSLTETGDKYLLFGRASWPSSGGTSSQVAALVAEAPATSSALQLPPPLSSTAGVQVTSSGGSAAWGPVSFTGSGLTVYAAVVEAGTVSNAMWDVTVTKGWLGSMNSYDFPDFSGTTGWDSSWNPPSGVYGSAVVLAVHANVTLSELLAFSRPQTYFSSRPLSYASLPIGTSLTLTGWSGTGTY